VKSSSNVFESVEHEIGSSPVTVNVKVLLVELPAPRRRVTTGARLSAATVVVVVVVAGTEVVVAGTEVVVAGTEVVVAGTEVVVAGTAVVVATETIVHFEFLPNLAQINFVSPTVIILPALLHFEPTSLAASAQLAPEPNISAHKTITDFFATLIF